jgi:hypothetical protein
VSVEKKVVIETPDEAQIQDKRIENLKLCGRYGA